MNRQHCVPFAGLALVLVLAACGGGGDDDVAAAEPADWRATFGGLPGADRELYAVTVFDDGSGSKVYVGGSAVQFVGGIAVQGVAAWDGTSWSALGPGVVGSVNAFAVFDDGSGEALYVGGSFSQVDGLDGTSNLARWDGASWSSVGGGFDGRVNALHVHDDGGGPSLYATGDFANAGGAPANAIARWDGVAWSPLGSGIDGEGFALETFNSGSGDTLYVGGRFTLAGGVVANHIAAWDGATFQALDSGVAGDGTEAVHALEVFDDGSEPKLFVGGVFSGAGSASVGNLARWDGGFWTSVPQGTSGPILALLAFEDDQGDSSLFIAGSFLGVGGPFVSNVTRYFEQGWYPVGLGLDRTCNALTVTEFGGQLEVFAVGLFERADDRPALRMARWTGDAWESVGGGLTWSPDCLATFDDGQGSRLYAAGYLGAGGTDVRQIARWSGTAWENVGGGADNTIYTLTVFDDGSGTALYAGGVFEEVGGSPAAGIARWDGADWSAVGAGFGGTGSTAVEVLVAFDSGDGDELHAGGAFTEADGAPAARLARWDGVAWSEVGGGLDGPIHCAATFDDGDGPALFVGGEFTSAGGVAATRIARWDGSEWSALGSGLNDRPFALFVFDDGAGPSLFAGGEFDTAGGTPASAIARWDGLAWHGVGGGLGGINPRVGALAAFDDGDGVALFAGGVFSTAGGVPAPRLARWDGTAWSTVAGELTPGGVTVLLVCELDGTTTLAIGGSFRVSPAGDSFLAAYGPPVPTSE